MVRSTIIALFTLATFSVNAQDWTPVTGEYQVGYIKEGKVYTFVGNDAGYSLQETSLTNIVQGDGAQYTTIYRSATGRVFVLQGNSTTVYEHSLTTSDDTLHPDYVQGFWRSYFALKNGEIWYLPRLEDEMQQNGNTTSNKWIKLTQPTSPVVKIVSGATTGFGLAYIIALCEDGSVWEYRKSSTTPTELSWASGEPAIDIAQVGGVATVIVTATKIYTRGYYATLTGGSILTQDSSFSDVTSVYAAAQRPYKKIVTTYNSFHIIDANDNLFATGNNMQGILGHGDQYTTWRYYEYFGSRSPYLWSWANGERQMGLVKVAGAEVADIITHNTVVAYVYLKDKLGNWYSYGRNKARTLGNGKTLSIYDETYFSEFINIPAPRNVNPFALGTFTPVSAVDTTAARPPVANAGIDRQTDSTTITLFAYGTHQQQYLKNTNITLTYAWTQTSGKTAAIASPTSPKTTVSGLEAGEYVFRVTVNNSQGGSDYDEVKIIVHGDTPPQICNCIILKNTIFKNAE